ncbi:hypothetical protein HNQ94_000401 [Salirhabdus euzebyi]|uniref:Uncharacterized protein n=1 Tax=Salirhabdus euzebyi TaxID=394506 RepID=A0A841PT61_9BACI|nr:hypothetical protein [Salirhabdus euzebyi]MBB6451980.1 hypothetical protein [Salirhabdus euzebyi]
MVRYHYDKYNANVSSGYYWDRYNAVPVYAEGSWQFVSSGYGNSFSGYSSYSFSSASGNYSNSGSSKTIKPESPGMVYTSSGNTVNRYRYP